MSTDFTPYPFRDVDRWNAAIASKEVEPTWVNLQAWTLAGSNNA